MRTNNNTPKSLVDKAYERIKNDITEDFLHPGEKIQINKLIERYSASETPIKQALNRLMMEGLVENIPRKGMKVKKLTWEEISEILDIRLMMETYSLKRVMTIISSNKKIRQLFENNLKESFEYAEKATNLESYLATFRLDQEFHQLYLKCTGNKRLVSLYSSLNTHGYAIYMYGRESKENTLNGLTVHERIYNALVIGNEEEALKQINIHNQNTKEILDLMFKVGDLQT